MRNKKLKTQPFKVFETEEEWSAELERIVDLVIEKVTARLSDFSARDEQTQEEYREDEPQNLQSVSIKDANATSMTKEEADKRVREVRRQAEEYARKNPNFDMNEEIKNRDFCYLIFKAGVSVEDAYFLIHKEEIMRNRENSRISENGVYKNSGISTRLNPEKFSDDDVEKILERIQNGEQIKF